MGWLKGTRPLEDLAAKWELLGQFGVILVRMAIETKLTVMNADGTQVLPAYFSDNYVTLLPGETRVIEIRYPSAKADKPSVALRGWNVTATSAELRP